MSGEERKEQDPFAEPSVLLRESHAGDIAERAGVPWDGREFKVSFLRWNLYVSHPELSFRAPDFLNTFVIRLLTLLYLAHARAVPLANRWVPYRELKDGLFYTKSFQDTVEDRLLRRFAEDLDGLREAGLELGARLVEQGDLGMVLQTFPRLPLLFILWRGDEEFEPSARILFDASATCYFNAFELRMLCGEVVGRLINVADGRLKVPPPE
ncbi:DUF3786 domain-containing protein [Candidatus Solincola sp.]|nr:DUF3786 domain-containing protein [Actinomycetota bacterium]MDI7252514.1 DUF3786 domain-containing protein [Actinomycetota bacterium]